jgi:8-oxo-dGTP pyrophosphatase MutT (NUDIX family)
MYKVFLNDRLIKIGGPVNITINKTSVKFDDLVTADEVKEWFSSFLKKGAKKVFLSHRNPELFFNRFKHAFHEISAAGGVLISENRLLFIFRNGKWDLPKGKLDNNESPEEAALREVDEETGVKAEKIVRQLPSTYHIYQSPYHEGKPWIFKQTFWFEMACNGMPSGIPQYDEGITLLKWVEKDKLDEVLSNTHENLKQIIDLYRD